ncbi:uncharacterized protein N7511_000336 [Penicillium nucicola]|uniref:uncharacterized protein n=1 Tax=Penicillium nucicola TaxID=1850975 RepID=UPI00254598F2|nr:uncharacterized protein N7511_000336 [Penicillium nucicola]KAJ5775325.1 hypothetical protein N7511_000336 [Penicillium nucicola]
MSDKKVDKETDKLTKSMKGLVIGASGNIPGLMHSQIQKMVEKCGAIYTDRNVSKCTHLVTTQAGIKKGLTKVGLAIESGDCHLVNVDWLLKSIENKSPEKVQQYSLLQSKDVKVTDLTDKKRARKSTSVDEDTHPSKKVRDEDQSKLAKLTALVDKSVVMKYKSRKTRSVWMDNSGEIWDATLINSIAHPDKPQETSIVRLQIITQSHCCVRLQTIAQSHYCNYISYEIKREIPDTSAKHTVLHDKKVYRDLNHAKDDFKKRFRELSGLDWKCRNQIPTDDKKHVFVELQLEQPLVLVSENHKLADSVERVLSLIFENGLLDQISNRMSSGGRKMYLMQDSDGYALQAAIALLRKIRVLEGDALKSYDLQVKHLQSLYSVLMMVGQQLKPTKDELLSLDLALKLHTASNIVGQKNLTKALTRSQISHALGLATLTPGEMVSWCSPFFLARQEFQP